MQVHHGTVVDVYKNIGVIRDTKGREYEFEREGSRVIEESAIASHTVLNGVVQYPSMPAVGTKVRFIVRDHPRKKTPGYAMYWDAS